MMTELADPPELTVILLTFNREHLVVETLESLARQRWDGHWDIVLLDNESTDNTPHILEHWVLKLPVPARVHVARGGKGVSFVRNAAMAVTNAASVVFVDDDDVIDDGFVAAMGQALRTHQFVGPRHDYHRLNDASTALHRTGQTEALPRFDDVAVVSGGGFGCRRELWERVGGNDETFGTGQDIDFSMRVAALGDITPHFCADALYCVRVRTTTRSAFRQGRRMAQAAVRIHTLHTPDVPNRPDATRRWRRRWLALALRVRGLGDPSNRPRWAFDAGHEIGRLLGIIAHRTWYP